MKSMTKTDSKIPRQTFFSLDHQGCPGISAILLFLLSAALSTTVLAACGPDDRDPHEEPIAIPESKADDADHATLQTPTWSTSDDPVTIVEVMPDTGKVDAIGAGGGGGSGPDPGLMAEKAARCEVVCEQLGECMLDANHPARDGCTQRCARSLYDGLLNDRDVRCFERASSCSDVNHCVVDVSGCDEACDASLGCGVHDEPEACRDWCGLQVATGTVSFQQLDCIKTQERRGQCADTASICGLDL